MFFVILTFSIDTLRFHAVETSFILPQPTYGNFPAAVLVRILDAEQMSPSSGFLEEVLLAYTPLLPLHHLSTLYCRVLGLSFTRRNRRSTWASVQQDHLGRPRIRHSQSWCDG